MSSQSNNDLPILAFDIDGTLMTHQDCIHQRDIELLTMPDPPVILVPTTGRSLFSIRRILRSFGICDGNPLRFPMVLQNGSLVYNPYEEKLRHTPFSLDTQDKLIALFKTVPDVSFLFFLEDRLRLLNPTPFGLEETRHYMSEPEIYTDTTPPEPSSKILCMCEDAERIVEVRDLVKDFDLEVARSKPTILEFNAPGVNKGTGLEYLVKYNGWDKTRVFCAGDGDNDLEMFRRFENSFTPDTSPKYIQGMAKYVVDISLDGLLASMLKRIQ
jgi:Cof subfamily protein (haloacid dehalogenase superfamily)